MKLRNASASICLLLLISGCSGSGRMVSYTGVAGTPTVYSKYYDRGLWLDEGKLGIQVVVDHGPTPNPKLVVATGYVTVYLVNLESQPRRVTELMVTTPKGERSFSKAQSLVADPRSRTGLRLGSIPIFDYGTKVPVKVTLQLDDGPPKVLDLVLPRLKETELEAWGPKGRPPYPWFEPPYYPFEPPLSIVERGNAS